MIVPSFTAKGGIASVVSGYRGSELEEAYQIHYIETYCDGGKAAKLCKSIAAYAAFVWELLTCRPDLIHIHSAFGASLYRKAPFVCVGALLGIPVVNHIHGSELSRFYREASNRKKKIVKSVYDRCTKIIALSNHWRDEFSEFISSDKIEVIENYGIAQDEIFGSDLKDGNTVLFLGFLSERKGCLDIPPIAAKVCRKISDVRFVLAGSGNEQDVHRIMELADEYAVTDCLEFPGWIRGAEKEKLLKQASLFLLPSYAEGMPMSILEAMGYGLPVVSTTVGGIPQLVTNGENGFLLEPGDTDGLADAVTEILSNLQLQTEMGRKSQEIVKTAHSLEDHCHRLMAVYEQCCTKR